MRTRVVGAALTVTAVLVLAGCTGPGGRTGPAGPDGGGAAVGVLRLVSYDSCGQAIDALRRAAVRAVTPYGLVVERYATPTAARDAAAEPQATAPSATADQSGSYSTTNVHEAGVDEPDLVKTDGRRIVTVADGRLRVVDVASRRITGTLDLPGLGTAYPGRRWYGQGGDLLLRGDRALVLLPAQQSVYQQRLAPSAPQPQEPTGSRLLVVGLAGARPVVQARITLDGEYVDARQVGDTIRVVVRSGPRLRFSYPDTERRTNRTGEDAALRANRRVVEQSTVDDWLPRWQVEQDGRRTRGQVPCERLAHPAAYTGAAMITVHTVHLGGPVADVFGRDDPVSVVGDGDTVYGTGRSLYVATGVRWLPGAEQRTDVHRFDISGSGRPRYVASGRVAGTLIGQYAMSEHDGYLRIATTLDSARSAEGDRASVESAVHVLAERNGALVEVGKVGGLGKGERIYAVRFIGTVGYVVTFRQLDPLYTVDLRDPRAPRVVGELKIPGYSAYLHPAGDGLLLGVGQDATAQGRQLGTQVSLFDVRDPARPVKLAGLRVPAGWSEAEVDPHAFLYWPDRKLVVLPVSAYGGMGTGALGLTLRGSQFATLGTVRHLRHGWPGGVQIRRCLVIDQTLWTVSEVGLKASDLDTLAQQASIPF